MLIKVHTTDVHIRLDWVDGEGSARYRIFQRNFSGYYYRAFAHRGNVYIWLEHYNVLYHVDGEQMYAVNHAGDIELVDLKNIAHITYMTLIDESTYQYADYTIKETYITRLRMGDGRSWTIERETIDGSFPDHDGLTPIYPFISCGQLCMYRYHGIREAHMLESRVLHHIRHGKLLLSEQISGHTTLLVYCTILRQAIWKITIDPWIYIEKAGFAGENTLYVCGPTGRITWMLINMTDRTVYQIMS